MAKIFILEDDETRIVAFEQALAGDELTVCRTLALGKQHWAPPYDILLLDHDLADAHYAGFANGEAVIEGTGTEFATWLAEEHSAAIGDAWINIHSWNSAGAERMQSILQDHRVTRFPFGPVFLELIVDEIEAMTDGR